jgi:hypothetical protein
VAIAGSDVCNGAGTERREFAEVDQDDEGCQSWSGRVWTGSEPPPGSGLMANGDKEGEPSKREQNPMYSS